jgi:hypothetical protein
MAKYVLKLFFEFFFLKYFLEFYLFVFCKMFYRRKQVDIKYFATINSFILKYFQLRNLCEIFYA